MARQLKLTRRYGNIDEFFPARKRLTPWVVAFVYRAEELRIIGTRVDDFGASEERKREHYSAFLLDIRTAIVSLYDAAEKLNYICGCKEFADTLTTDELQTLKAHRKAANRAASTWDRIRSRTCAHIDVDHLAASLDLNRQNLNGFFGLGRRFEDNDFQVAELAVWAAMTREPTKVTDGSKEVQAALNLCGEARMAIANSLQFVLIGYDRMTD